MAKRKSLSYDPTPEQIKTQQLYKDLREKLHEVKKIAGELDDFVPIRDWFDDLCCADRFDGEYGYTVELREEIRALQERLEAYPDKPPRIENAMDQLKFEFFVANFSKIPLDALEWVVKTVKEKGLTV